MNTQKDLNDITLDLFTPQDAENTPQLFRAVYGDKYPIKTYYQPDELLKAWKDGEVFPAVARKTTGELVGFVALYRSGPNPNVYEVGLGLVLVPYRGKGVLEKLMILLIENLYKLKSMDTVFGEAVCNHVFTQKSSLKLGLKETALEVDLMPAQTYAKENSAKGRVTSIVMFMPEQHKSQKIFIPSVLKDSWELFYDGFRKSCEFVLDCEKRPRESNTKFAEKYFDFASVARLTLWQSGLDLPDMYLPMEERLLGKGAAVIQVWLGLNEPHVNWTADFFRKQGFFPGGILPNWLGHDALLMQKIMHKPNWDDIQTCSPHGDEIVKTVKKYWEGS